MSPSSGASPLRGFTECSFKDRQILAIKSLKDVTVTSTNALYNINLRTAGYIKALKLYAGQLFRDDSFFIFENFVLFESELIFNNTTQNKSPASSYNNRVP